MAQTALADRPAQAASPRAPQLPSDGGKGRIFLIDAYSFIFRAYHAMARQRPMSTKTGIPTSASYVFINMLRKLRDDFNPEYLAAVFDVGGSTFRDDQAGAITSVRKFDLKTQTFQEIEYKGYKANRAEMPPDLAQQVPYIRRALQAYRIPILQMEGYEADDVIGTLARQAAERNYAVYVVSSDKDMLQLVNEQVCVLNPPKDNLICDREKVEEILGVPPERVVDVMALRGDQIDNVPGAPGIGDKGSVDLIQRFGSLENLLDHAADVEKKTYRESLLNNRDTILLSKKLVTIDCNVPIELELEAMRAGEPEATELRELFTQLEFTSLLKELVTGVDLAEANYREAKSADDIADMLRGVAENNPLAIAVDRTAVAAVASGSQEEDEEQSGSLPLTVAVPAAVQAQRLAMSSQAGNALAINLSDPDMMAKAKQALEESQLPKSLHDSKATLRVLEEQGIQVAGLRHDPMLYSYLLDPTYSSHTLPEVALRHFNLNLSGMLEEDADVTGRLTSELRKQVEDRGLLGVYDSIDFPLLPVLKRMEEVGVKIDCDVLASMSQRLDADANTVAKKIYDLCGSEFNINSPKQLGDILFNRLALPKPVKYGKGKTVSTAVDVLENLATQHEVPRLVLEYRQLSKLKSTYVDALPVLLNRCTNRLHTTFDQTNTATGRLSSKNPNLQNIPIRTELGREIRAAFVAEPGYVLLSADYSQIELRLLAHFSEDDLLVEAFRRGDDIHTLTASQVFGVPPLMIDAEHRRRAKAVNFGIVYGQTPFGLAQALSIEQKEAKRFIEAYFAKYTGVRRWLDHIIAEAHREKKVSTLFGRVRPLPDIDSRNPNLRGFAERTAMNTPLQGTAADLIKIAMIRVDTELQKRALKSRMTLQVHDELVFEVPENEVEVMTSLVREHMERVHSLKVPLLVELGTGQNWRDLQYHD